MPKVVLYNQLGSQVGELELNNNVFGVEDNQQAIYQTVVAERAAMRQGTQKAKNRSEVSGGGVVFAPTPRSHAIKVNKKVVRLAMRCALSAKVRNNNIVVLDDIQLETFKTKGLVEVLKAFNLQETKVALVLAEANGNVEIAGRNIPNVLVSNYSHVSVYQMMNAKNLVITKAAVEKFEEVLK